MDRDRAVAAHRAGRDRGGAAVRRRRVAWLLARKNFWGKSLSVDGVVHLPTGAAAGGDRLSAADLVRSQGLIGAFLYDHAFGIVLSFRWTGAALACGVMGFPLLVRAVRLSIEAIDRRLEDAAATLGANRLWVFATVTVPLALPGDHRRDGAVLRQGARRVRRHHHVRVQHPGGDSDAVGRDLHLYQRPRRRRRARPASWCWSRSPWRSSR